MTADSLLFFDLAITVFILGFALAVLSVFYARLYKKFHFQSKERDSSLHLSHKHSSRLLDDASKKASSMIEKAQTKALELINSASFYNEETKHVFEDQLKAARDNQFAEYEATSKEFLESYQKALEEIKSQQVEKLHTVSEDIEKVAHSQVADFGKVIEEETFDAQKIVEQKIEEEYQKLKTELESYKKTEYAKIDENIYKILRFVSEKALGKGLSFEDSERLVVEALEEAKREMG
jgi:hypothetical protein